MDFELSEYPKRHKARCPGVCGGRVSEDRSGKRSGRKADGYECPAKGERTWICRDLSRGEIWRHGNGVLGDGIGHGRILESRSWDREPDHVPVFWKRNDNALRHGRSKGKVPEIGLPGGQDRRCRSDGTRFGKRRAQRVHEGSQAGRRISDQRFENIHLERRYRRLLCYPLPHES